MADQVVIEFVVDTTQIESAIDLLERIGQVDAKTAADFKKANAEINKQSSAIKATAAATIPLKRSIEDVNRVTKSMTSSFVQGFEQGVIESLKEAGVTLDEFLDALKNGPQVAAAGTESLRQRLKNLTQQLGELKLSGQDNTEQFKQLRAEAAKIQDAMADAGAEIRNVASDTSTLDNLLGTTQAVAGGFLLMQGAAGLFGDGSKELDKTLLKVNQGMAAFQGLQSVANALQKEGAVIQLLSNKQRIIANAQIAIENGLTSTSIVVRTAATIAQRALNAAMAANPILLLIAAVVAATAAIYAYVTSSREAERQTAELNSAVEAATEGFENYAAQIKQQSELATSELEKNGALQSKILETQLQAEQDINKKRSEEISRLRRFLTSSRDADEEAIKAATDRLKQLAEDRNAADAEAEKKSNGIKKQLRDEDLKSQIAAAETALLAAAEGSEKQLQLQQRLVTLQAQADLNAAGLTEAEKTAIATKAARDRLELQIAFNKRQIDLELKAIEARLVNVREGSQEELDLKLQQLRLQVQAEIQSTKLSEAEKKAIKDKGLEDQLKLQREFNAKVRKEDIEAQIARNNAELAQVKKSHEEKLLLTISNLELTAAREVDAAKENSAKIKEINAQRDADIAAARKADIELQAQQEIDLINAVSGAQNRSLAKIANDEKQTAENRIAAIRQLTEFELGNIQLRERSLRQLNIKRLISDEEYNLRYAQLQNEKAQITERSEDEITKIYKTEAERRREIQKQNFETAVQVSNELFSILDGLNQLRADRDQQRLEAERARVDELRESGAITEKEAIARQKRLDIEEKRLRAQHAQREKQIAVFKALLAIPQAYLTGLAQGGPIVGAIYAGLAAVQAALVIAKPIPKFRTGKKNQYEGPGIIGEAGQEIFEHDGKRYLAQKETLVWLGKDDKVFTPMETKRMLPRVDKELMKQQPDSAGLKEIDYDHLAKAVGKEVGKHVKVPGLTVDENGFKAYMEDGLSRTRYMDKYYSSK